MDFGGVPIVPPFHPTEDVHGDLAYVLFALIVSHVLTALWHQFVRRDRLCSACGRPATEARRGDGTALTGAEDLRGERAAGDTIILAPRP